jgi:hypothetical protein
MRFETSAFVGNPALAKALTLTIGFRHPAKSGRP